MRKKILTIACSTVLGLTGGMHAYAGVNCTPGGVCEVTDGDQADITGQAYEQLHLGNGGTVTGSNATVGALRPWNNTLMVIGSELHLVDSKLIGSGMYVYDSEFEMTGGGQIELQDVGDGLEIFSSRAALEEVDISIYRDTGLLIANESDFKMSGGDIGGSAKGALVEVYGDISAPTPTRASFKASATTPYSIMQNIADDAATLIVGGNAIVSLEDYAVQAAGQGGVALLVTGEGAKVDMKASSSFRGSLGSIGNDGAALLLGDATGADVALDFMDVSASSAIFVSGDAHGNRVSVSDSIVQGANALVSVEHITSSTPGTILHLRAENSLLFGEIDIYGGPKDAVTMELLDGSRWNLTSAYGTQSGRSELGRLDIRDSELSLVEHTALTAHNTLVIGEGQTGAYNARGDSYLELRTRLNEGGALSNQFTDRLLVNGDVSGQTKVWVIGEDGSVSADTGRGADKGISIVQVSGSAQEGSFILDHPGGYVAMNGQPWQYKLYAYGPGASEGTADNAQRLVDGNNPHWDWRLQNAYVATPPVTPPPVTPPPVTPPPVTPPPVTPPPVTPPPVTPPPVTPPPVTPPPVTPPPVTPPPVTPPPVTPPPVTPPPVTPPPVTPPPVTPPPVTPPPVTPPPVTPPPVTPPPVTPPPVTPPPVTPPPVTPPPVTPPPVTPPPVTPPPVTPPPVTPPPVTPPPVTPPPVTPPPVTPPPVTPPPVTPPPVTPPPVTPPPVTPPPVTPPPVTPPPVTPPPVTPPPVTPPPVTPPPVTPPPVTPPPVTPPPVTPPPVTPPPVTPPPVTPPPVTPPPVTPPPAGTGGIRAVAPQVYSYLVAPNALFQTGLSNVRNLHRHLAETRAMDAIAIAVADDGFTGNGAFLHLYRGDWDYRTNLGAASYGVDADVRHSAAQGGFNLAVLDDDSGVMQIGLVGSVGDVDFTPQDVNGARKTRLDQWTISPYLSWQSAGGAYVDATISQGGFKGNVSTVQRGRTARLKGSSQALSLGSGFPFVLGKVTLEPQVQLVWQRLEFDGATDVDGFLVHLGTMTQSTARAGAEMSFGGGAVRAYGRAYFAHTFNDGQLAWLGDTFQVGRMGNALETSFGFDSSLGTGRRVSLYGDIGHQTRIGGVGHQGWAANLGVKARF